MSMVEPSVIGGGDGSTYAYDAFGRLRVSNPYTLFDSNNRYADNGKFDSLTGTGTVTFNANEGLIDLNVDTASGDEVLDKLCSICLSTR
jgi:hypothetical protein